MAGTLVGVGTAFYCTIFRIVHMLSYLCNTYVKINGNIKPILNNLLDIYMVGWLGNE